MVKRHLTTGVWVAGIGAIAVAATTVVVLPLLSPAQQRTVGPILLAAAVACIFITRAQLRRLQRQQSATGGALPPAPTQQAVGGPCDGQHLTLPATGPPAEIWLADDNAPNHLKHHRHTLERRSDGSQCYRYAPPPPDAA